MVLEPRTVLQTAFGTTIPPHQAVLVHDSTADHRFMVLPQRPAGTEGYSREQLRALVTRDSLVGVRIL
jgi:nitrile hydratase